MLARKLRAAIAFADACKRGKGKAAREEWNILLLSLHDAHALAHAFEQTPAPRQALPMPERWPENVTAFRVRP